MYSRTQASLSKPAELNPPAKGQEEFAKKFGITWKAALEKGVVYNAVDGCKRLGVDGVVMDKTWVTLFSRRCITHATVCRVATHPVE